MGVDTIPGFTGLDIAADGTVLAALMPYQSNRSGLYSVNLATGAATFVDVIATFPNSLVAVSTPNRKGDFDGDGKADIGVFRTSSGEWLIRRSIDGHLMQFPYGSVASSGLDDVPVPADYDGDGRTDLAIYRRTTGEWFISLTTAGEKKLLWGAGSSSGLGDTPVPGDYDGDGAADIAVYRQSTGEWFIYSLAKATGSRFVWGSPLLGDIPLR